MLRTTFYWELEMEGLTSARTACHVTHLLASRAATQGVVVSTGGCNRFTYPRLRYMHAPGLLLVAGNYSPRHLHTNLRR